MKRLVILVTALILTIFNPVRAANDFDTYIGFQYGAGEADDSVVELDQDYVLLRLGIMPNDHFALEYRIGEGVSDDSYRGVNFELENVYGLYGLYHFNLSEATSIYGIAGYSKLSFKGSLGQVSAQADESGLSLGLGAQLYGFNVEFMQYLNETALDVTAVAIGYSYYFE